VCAFLAGCPDPSDSERGDRVASEPVVTNLAEVPITEANLHRREDSWPYHVRLTSEAEQADTEGEYGHGLGVLLRVVDEKTARVDFGAKGGIHELPIRMTDLVDTANQIRTGERPRTSGNLAVAIGSALVDTGHHPLRAYPRSEVPDRDILFVASHLDAEIVSAMAEAIGPLDELDGMRVVFLAQGEAPNDEIQRVLSGAGWTPPFLRTLFVPAFTEGYLGADRPLPWLTLLTPFGRVLYEGPWSQAAASDLRALADERSLSRTSGPP
jgi:hypothetical protein